MARAFWMNGFVGLAASAALALGCNTDPAISGAPGVGGTDLDAGSGADHPAFDLVFPDATAFVASAGDASCAAQTVLAERLPLDLYFMIDTSGSMLDATAQGMSKWDAVRAAMTSFVRDPQSAGIGVGLQYFPQFQPGVPEGCQTDAACGQFGPCYRLRTCTVDNKLCDKDTDCGKGQQCVLVGECVATQRLCAPAGAFCPPAQGQAANSNPCVAWDGYCLNRDMCEPAPYATPAVPIMPLPNAATLVVASLMQKKPEGLTPTAAALTGAIQQAQARAKADAGRRIAVVLATDGFPSHCMPTDVPGISAIASSAARGASPVPTFVIGVFAPADAAAATQTLNAWAVAGGTSRAFVINTNQDVTKMFQAALTDIRTAALACEYKIPPATMGKIDFGKVNVQFTSGSGQVTTVGYVPDKASCHPTKGGWYYDVNPNGGAMPGTIVACDVTCGQLRADSKGRVDIALGCQTRLVE